MTGRYGVIGGALGIACREFVRWCRSAAVGACLHALCFVSQCFAVRSLGWVEMAEEDLAPGKSSVAVNNCIRQLSYCKNDIRDTVGIWGEVSNTGRELTAGSLTLCCASQTPRALRDVILRVSIRCICPERQGMWAWCTL